MSHIFISYARKDIRLAQKIVDALAANDLDTWIDWKSIPKGEDWEQEIYRGIEEADAFLFLISPDSAGSEMCYKEIAHALRNGKRILAIVLQDTDRKIIHPEINKRNWIFCRERQDNFKKAIEEVRKTIQTDYEWLKYHTALQVKALEWGEQKDTSRLLRGGELKEAELQFVKGHHEPQPTELQRRYLLTSREFEDQQRRRVAISLSIGFIVVVVLALIAWQQKNLAVSESNAKTTALVNEKMARSTAVAEANARATAQFDAENKARIVRARALAAESVALRDKNFQVSLLLGVEGYQADDNVQTRGALKDNEQAYPSLRRYLNGHSGGISSLEISPDGRLLASADKHGKVILWNLASGKPLNENLEGYSVAFSPSGKILATSGGQGSDLTLWDVATGQPMFQPEKSKTGGIGAIAFSPDGRFIASGDSDSNVIIWDVTTGQSLLDLQGHSGWVFSVMFSPDGQILASGGTDNTIILWDVNTWQPIRTLTGHSGAIQSLAFSSDSKLLASGSNDTTIILWDVASGLPTGEPFSGHSDLVFSIAFSPDDKTLVSGSADRSIRTWDVQSGRMIGVPLVAHTDWVNDVIFSPDGKTLVTGSQDSSIIVWDVNPSPSNKRALEGHTGLVWSVAFSPDGKRLASGSHDGTIILWDVASGQPVGKPWQANSGGVNTVAFSPDGKTLASGGDDRNIILWDVASGRPIGQPLVGHTDIVLSLAFSPDGQILASGGDTRILLWDMESRKPLGKPLERHTNWVSSVVFSPDGKFLASGSWDSSILLWDTSSKQPVGHPLRDTAERITRIAFSPTGKILASGGIDDDGGVLDNSVTFWDVDSGNLSSGHTGTVSSVSFSPDGKLLASSGGNNNIIIWDVLTHQPIGDPLTEKAWITDVAFSPDGKMLAAGEDDNNVVLWDMDLASWVETACERAGRNLSQNEWQQFFPGEAYRVTCLQWPLATAEEDLSFSPDQEQNSCDDFDAKQLGAEWKWVNPLNDAIYSLTENPGSLRLRVSGQGHDLYENLDAPRLLQRITGDFTAETRLSIDPVEVYQGAGLLFWHDDNTYVRLERTVGNSINFVYRIDGNYQSVETPFDDPPEYLQLQLAGNELTSRYSQDGITWIDISSLNFFRTEENLIGLDLINEWQAGTIQADFDFFHINNCQ
jgi:WD40 repeat protein